MVHSELVSMDVQCLLDSRLTEHTHTGHTYNSSNLLDSGGLEQTETSTRSAHRRLLESLCWGASGVLGHLGAFLGHF